MTRTNRDWSHAEAEKQGIPLRTLEQVKADLAEIKARSKGKRVGHDKACAHLMLSGGRLTDEATAYVREYVK